MKTLNYRYPLFDYILLGIVVAAVYCRLVYANFIVVWDDSLYVLGNETAHGFSFEHIRSSFKVSASLIGQYNPIALLSFMADYSLWRLWPGGYHLTNIIIHFINGIMVYRLLLRLNSERLLALVATAIFLLHPVQVESVAWISERKGLLSLLFSLVSWEWYCRYCEVENRSRVNNYIFSLLAFVVSLLAKPSNVVLPVVLLLYDRCFVHRDRRISAVDKIPFFIIAALFTLIEIFSEKPEGEKTIIGYHGGTPLTTAFTMLPVFCRYLALLAWPSGLNALYHIPVYLTITATVAASAVLLVGLFYAGFRLFRYDRKLGFWFFFYWVGLLPVSQIVPFEQPMFDHYLYFPIIGVAALAGSAAVWLRQRVFVGRSVLLYSILLLWILTLSFIAFKRCNVWRDSETLFTNATTEAPNSYWAWYLLGLAHSNVGKTMAAKMAYERSIAQNPSYTDPLWSLGNIYTDSGELDKGFGYLQKLLKINPKYVKGWVTLGNNYSKRGDYVKAEEMYGRAYKLQPDAVETVLLLGRVAVLQKQFDTARNYFKRAETIKKGDPEIAYLLAATESQVGRTDEALFWLEKSLERGNHDYYKLNTGMELSGIWDNVRFNYLMQRYFPEQETTR